MLYETLYIYIYQTEVDVGNWKRLVNHLSLFDNISPKLLLLGRIQDQDSRFWRRLGERILPEITSLKLTILRIYYCQLLHRFISLSDPLDFVKWKCGNYCWLVVG